MIGAVATSAAQNKIKTGNYYIMTSDTTPSPFVASTFNNSAYALGGSPYQVFDNNNTTAYYGNTTSAGAYVGASLAFNNSITVRKVYFKGTNASGKSNQGNFKVELLVSGVWTMILDYNVGSGGGYDGTLTVSYANVTGIRCRFQYGSGSTDSQALLYSCQVTEWS